VCEIALFLFVFSLSLFFFARGRDSVNERTVRRPACGQSAVRPAGVSSD
jgi:hypothetical protein